MIKNIVFDYGAVLIDWNPHYLYDPYFGDRAKADRFLGEICTLEWNTTLDGGRPFHEACLEKAAQYPEFKEPIMMYETGWRKMVNGEIPGMFDVVKTLKDRGYKIYGLTNWSAETFPWVRETFPIFTLLEGMVVSGEEFLLKPGPEIYNLLLKRYGLKAEECVFIDDNPANAEGARRVGMKGLVFRGADTVLHDLAPILAEE